MGEMSFRERASLLLAGLEEGREVRAYLKQFSRQAEGCFAVIKVGGAVMERDLDPLADALALLQFLELPPLVIFGAGPQLDKDLEAAGIPHERRDGLRVTPEEAMSIVGARTSRMAIALSDALRRRGAASVTVQGAAVKARAIDTERYGAVGEVTSIDAELLTQILSTGSIPLLPCVHADDRGRLLNLNADGLANAAAEALRPQKIVFVTGTGGVLGEDGSIINSINLAEEGEELFSSPWLEGGMRHKMEEVRDLLERLPLASSVSIVSAQGLVRELFTHKGSGTLIRRGEAIARYSHASRDAFTKLIESAFGRQLKEEYWEALDPLFSLMSEHKRACAIVTRGSSVPVLDKFAVASSAQGEGLAKSLWEKLQAEAPRLVWRSRSGNLFNGFYSSVADGFVRRGPWLVFWTGDGLEGEIHQLADELFIRPGDFVGDL
ncbi:acetylglutamate kinase [Parvularcula sp. ZS-1/3]|uniref:acetylglutamate kinase n=1 Tax=Parvularcula mediterranea TaxID=2732508 RepID=A0A7Y3W435_9PROT|nr:acetylglutamate kinase [Parvularcula mediterranea]NNU14781.1 acetylglutamate kinase [Parvularcula mediterranea]